MELMKVGICTGTIKLGMCAGAGVCVCVSIKGMGQGRLTFNINGSGVYWHPYTSALCVPAWQTFLPPCVLEGVFGKGRLLNSY